MIHEILYWLFGIGQDYVCLIAPLVGAALISAGASGLQYLGNNVQNNRLSRAQKEQNAFNAQQALEERLWSEKMKKWDVELANSAHQREVEDMKRAGLNPALLYGSSPGAGSAVPSAASGAAASGSYSPSQIDVPNLGGVLMNLRSQQAQIENINADTKYKLSRAEGQDIDNANKPEYWSKQLELMGVNKDEALANIAKLEQDVKTGAADEALKRANERLTGAKITQADLENTILAYKAGMAELDAKYYEAMKSLDLAIKSATLDKTEEEVKNLRKARSLMQAQIVTEGAKTKMFNAQAGASDEFARYTHKKTTWIDAEDIEKIRNLGKNSDLIDYLARKYDAEANYTDMKPLLEMLQVLGEVVSD